MDDELIARLRATQPDQPPSTLLAAAKAAYSWRTDDALSPPSYDSLLDDGLTSVRGEQESRLLSFSGQGIAVDLEVSTVGDARSLVGQLSPAKTAQITLRHGGAAELEVAADDLGRFLVDHMDAGPMSLRIALGAATLHTEWVLV